MKKGFTLIELLIVVAIIAILAAIAVPNFLEAQVRSKVSRVKNDQRSYATGLESYFVDNNLYPAHSRSGSGTIGGVAGPTNPNGGVAVNPTGETNNYNAMQANPANTTLGRFYTFAMSRPGVATARAASLTTPVSYLTSLFPDPFMDTRGATFFYFANSAGWILWSPGPDTDQNTGGDLSNNTMHAVETIYNIYVSQPSTALLAGAPTGANSFTYDSTNGTVSQGDVYRLKQ